MPIQPAALNTDQNNRLTSAYFEDRGDGTDAWLNYTRAADGSDATQGAIGDAAVTDPTASATVVAALKGVLSRLEQTVPVSTTALAETLLVSASPVELYEVHGYAAAAGFVQVHDKATVPVGADVPVLVHAVGAGESFDLSLGVRGRPFVNGVSIGFSSTGPTFTGAGAQMFADVLTSA